MSEQQASAPSDFELMDREDEEQILAELRGVPVDKFIYKNKRGEFELTYAGTKWVVRQMAEIGEAIRVDTHPKTARCEIDPEYLTCTVLGKRVKVGELGPFGVVALIVDPTSVRRASGASRRSTAAPPSSRTNTSFRRSFPGRRAISSFR